MSSGFPTGLEEVNKLMEEIDFELREKGVPIPYRPTKAFALLAVRLDQDLTPHNFGISGQEHDEFITRVYDWFQYRYADLLNLNFFIGNMIIKMQLDIWVIQIPRVGAETRFICSNKVPSVLKVGHIINGGTHNILDYVKNLPEGVRTNLSENDLKKLQEEFFIGLECYMSLKNVQKYPLVKEALVDYASTVSHLQGVVKNTGQAKWSASQATEKILKALLQIKGVKPQRSHNLVNLHNTIKSKIGVLDISDLELQDIQCDPGVRYGEIAVSLEESLKAHHNSLKIGGLLARIIASSVKDTTSPT